MKGISTLNRNNLFHNLTRLRLIRWREYIYKKNSYLIEFSQYYLYFMLYSFVGRIWEVIFMLIVDGTLQERGFLHIPICSIYGFAVLLILFLFYNKDYHWTTIYCLVYL